MNGGRGLSTECVDIFIEVDEMLPPADPHPKLSPAHQALRDKERRWLREQEEERLAREGQTPPADGPQPPPG